MKYQQWIRKYGSTILEDGPDYAALVAMVPESYAARWRKESARRNAIARYMGGSSRFLIPA